MKIYQISTRNIYNTMKFPFKGVDFDLTKQVTVDYFESTSNNSAHAESTLKETRLKGAMNRYQNNPRDYENLVELARLNFQLKNYGESIKFCNKVLDIYEDDKYINLLIYYAQRGVDGVLFKVDGLPDD